MLSYESVSKVVEKLSRRSIRVVLGDTELRQERALITRVLILRTCLLDDLASAVPSAGESWSRWLRTVCSINELDVGQYATDWSLLKETLLQSLQEWNEPDLKGWPRAFKQHVYGSISYKWIWNSVRDLMEGGAGFSEVIQWIVFDEKLNLTSLDLTDQTVEGYLASEKEAKLWSYDPPQELFEVIDDWAYGFNLQLYEFHPKHGSGATAETPRRMSTAARKSQRLQSDEDIRRWVQKRDVSNIPTTFWFPAGETCSVNRTARFQCVPKSMLKNRAISAEPTVLQYLQQDLFYVLDQWFSAHYELKNHIDLHDQKKSSDLCLLGSQSGSISSIDLSAASDSVTRTLVKILLQGTELDDLLDGLMTVRSTHVLMPDGSTVELEKFGGMGNGTTFPIETLIFSACCEYAVRTTHRGRHASVWRVYGDDILIETECVPNLLKILEQLHFKVNREKSYWSTTGHIFREACGMWALDGVDITPLRLSRRLRWTGDHSPADAAGWIALSNLCLQYRYESTRRAIMALLRSEPWFYFISRIDESEVRTTASPYFVVPDGTATQWKCRHRWAGSFRDKRGGYQVHQWRAKVFRDSTLPDSTPDEYHYFVWELGRYNERVAPELVSFGVSARGPSVQRWTDAWVSLS